MIFVFFYEVRINFCCFLFDGFFYAEKMLIDIEKFFTLWYKFTVIYRYNVYCAKV